MRRRIEKKSYGKERKEKRILYRKLKKLHKSEGRRFMFRNLHTSENEKVKKKYSKQNKK